MPARPALLALLCSAALVLGGAWPGVSASIVSLVSDPPPHPLPAWQCNAQDGSVTQDGVIVDASGVAWEAGIDYHAQSALRNTPKETYQWILELVEARHLEVTFYLKMIWLCVLHGAPEADWTATIVDRKEAAPFLNHLAEDQAVACPPQWLPVLLASISLSPPPPSPSPSPPPPIAPGRAIEAGKVEVQVTVPASATTRRRLAAVTKEQVALAAEPRPYPQP